MSEYYPGMIPASGWPPGYAPHQMKSGAWRFARNGEPDRHSYHTLALARHSAWVDYGYGLKKAIKRDGNGGEEWKR